MIEQGFLLPKDAFSAGVNLIICVIVSIWSTYWRKRQALYTQQWRYRAYNAWTLAWICWVVVWLLLLAKALLAGSAATPTAGSWLVTFVMLFDNLNALMFTLFYLHLTRGSEYFPKDAVADSLRIGLPSLLFCVVIYLVPTLAAGGDRTLSVSVHNLLSVCASVYAPILVGWGIYLRFGTRVCLAIGFAYGGLQPFIYAVQIQNDPKVVEFGPIITMLIAALKVVWATSVVAILALGAARTSATLVTPARSQGLSAGAFLTRVLFGQQTKNKKLGSSIKAHTLSILLAYVMCTVVLGWLYSEDLTRVGVALGVVTALLELIRRVWWVIELMDRNPTANG